MLTRIRHSLFFAREKAEDIKKVLNPIAYRNEQTLRVFALVSTAFWGFMAAVGFFSDVSDFNRKLPGYFWGALLSLVVYLCNAFVVPKFGKLLNVLLLFFIGMLYGIGLYMTFACTPDRVTITLFAFLLICPLLFIVKPSRFIALAIVTDVAFVLLAEVADLKPAEIRLQEIVNVVIFSALGSILGLYLSKLGFERFIFEYKADEAMSAEKETQNSLWHSLGDIYVSLVQVDLEKDTFKLIRTNQYIPGTIVGDEEGYSQKIRLAMMATTQEAYLPGVLDFVDTRTLAERIKGKRTITHEFVGKNYGWCRARYIAVNSSEKDNLRHVIYMVENINEQRNREKRLTTMAETDAMTGLYNRQAGSVKIKELLHENHEGMLCLFDIDKFKSVNDTFGHQTGDAVICAVAQAMRRAFRDNDVLMRLGGDEFVVFANDVTSEELGAKVIHRFFSILEKTVVEGKEDYRISVSLGATFAAPGDMFEKLYEQADGCTYQSKKITGKAFTFYRG